MPRRLLLTLIALGLTLALTAAPVSAGTPLGTLDQEQTPFVDNQFLVGSTVRAAQVFTAGLTGQLDHVDLFLGTFDQVGNPGIPGDDLTVEIWTTTSGALASPVPGATATLPAAELALAWYQVAITAPSVAGTQYAIVLASPASTCSPPADACWVLPFDESAPYANGAAYASFDGGTTWAPIALNTEAADFPFRTYVTVPPPPPASALPDAATAPATTGSQLATLGFAVLLLGSLGTLAFATVRRR